MTEAPEPDKPMVQTKGNVVTIDPDGSAGSAVPRLLAELTGIPTSNAQDLFF